MITLEDAIKTTKLTLAEVGDLIGLSKTSISRIKIHEYPNWEELEKKAIEEMVRKGYLTLQASGLDDEAFNDTSILFKVDSEKFVETENVLEINDLCKDLLDPTTTLNASIGMAVGSAGYGKTTAMQHFCATNDRAVYVLYVEGFTLPMLIREVTMAMSGSCSRGFDRNLGLIRDAAGVYRKLLVIDEADRLPLKYLESLRTINEYCKMPILLIGENGLLAKMQSLPRLESRIRKPLITFRPLSSIDVELYYKEAIGIDLSQDQDIEELLLKQCKGDFRLLVNDAQHLVQILNTNNIEKLTYKVVKDVFR